ncbi:MAG: hypothetical protein L7U78_03245, partial [Schleiferiaceae bacterium]|nr:hypothetical protein [Schleiferiaceae bacterium]
LHMFKTSIFFIVGSVLLLTTSSCAEKKASNPGNELSTQSEIVPPALIPDKIVLGEVILIADGYKASCAFMEGYGYERTRGKMIVEIYNWNLSDNVKYTDTDTYGLGTLVASGEFEFTEDNFEDGIADKIVFKINAEDKNLPKTYLSAKFTFTPEGTDQAIVGGSSYETL